MLVSKRPLTIQCGLAKNFYEHDAIAAFRVGRPSMDMTRRLTTVWPGLTSANTESSACQ